VGPLQDKKGEIVSDNEEMAALLNQHFTDVFTIEDLSNIEEAMLPNKHTDGICDIDINSEVVRKSILKLQDNKAAGVDEINSTFLKRSIEGLKEPLSALFRKSLDTGIVPMDWKKANVVALFKKGSKKDPGNYRPISLTSQIGKMLERIIKDSIIEYIESNNLLNNSQHGFRSKKSCLTNLLEFLQLTQKWVDAGDPVDVLYLDFQKAFDKVPHERLLMKIRSIGIDGKIYRWIEEWLKGREQRVVINGKQSTWAQVSSGVPQGSILGPILFIIFINDIDEGLSNRIFKFADDSKLMGKVGTKGQVDALRRDLDKVSEWAERWQMQFNIGKCKVLHFGSSNRESSYMLQSVRVTASNEEKDLGVKISHDLKFHKQVEEVTKKCYQILGLINRNISCKRKEVMVRLYKSLVRPHMDYCIQVWRPHYQGDIDQLERVQKRATKMIEECRGKDYNERLKICNLTTLETRRLRADLIEVFKILNGVDRLEGELVLNCVRDAKGSNITRGHSLKLYKHRIFTDVAKYSFGYRIIDEWNGLPHEMIKEINVDAFKGRLDKYLKHIRGFT
jgi:ribonuclease P/MRP protein subunit RPP40